MNRIWPLILLLCFSSIVLAQTDSTRIVLLQNDGVLPLNTIEQLTINYGEDYRLEAFGRRYSENTGLDTFAIESVSDAESSSLDGDLLIVYGDSAEVSEDDFLHYRAVIYAAERNLASIDYITQKIFGGRAFDDTLAMPIYGYEVGDGLKTEGGLRFSFG